MQKAGAAILAGGRSSRMGQNKALLELNSQSMIERLVLELKREFDPLVIVANSTENLTRLGVDIIPDQFPGCGPLAGIQAGLSSLPCEVVFVTACDMPFMLAEVGIQLLKRMGNADGAVVCKNSWPEPLCAVYRKTCLEPINALLGKGKYKVTSFYEQANIILVDSEKFELPLPISQVLMNVNTPEEFTVARELFLKQNKY